MSEKHTPGPWRIAKPSYGWDHFAAIVTERGLIGTAHIAALSRTHDETAANAALMAAAPELRDALRDLVASLADTGRHNSLEMAAARKALAKATAETAA